jgi:hypothetical protein
MVKTPLGATLGDAAIELIQFAEHHPWRFVLTVPVTIGLALVIAVIALKIVVLGPLTTHKASYENTRTRTRAQTSTRGK